MSHDNALSSRTPRAAHNCDARVKLTLLTVFTVSLFAASHWAGLAVATCALLISCAFARISPLGLLTKVVPLYGILAMMIVFGSVTGNVSAPSAWMGAFSLHDGALADFAPFAVAGSFGISPAGFEAAVFNAVRILLLVLASLAVSFTTSAEALIDAFRWFVRPLRALKVPVDDVAMVLALAVRFIPTISAELAQVRDAHVARGALLNEGALHKRAAAWGRVLIPLFVGLFRRADRLGTAMEARCYGAPEERTSLSRLHCGAKDRVVLAVGMAICIACALA